MNVATSQQIARYYDFFRDKEIVLTKANLLALKMNPREVYVKCNGGQWPCIINSSSLQMAKVILGTSSGAFAEMKKNSQSSISIRYCFVDEKNEPIHFFVNCSLGDVAKYQNTEELAIVTLNFTQRPPDELISRLGEFAEANENFATKKNQRIDIDANSLRRLSIEKEGTLIVVENIPRRCMLKYLAFGGAGVMMMGIPKFLKGKPVALRLDFADSEIAESLMVQGIISNASFLEGKQDISVVEIEFTEQLVPMSYKFRINTFITTYQKVTRPAAASAPQGVPVSQAGENSVRKQQSADVAASAAVQNASATGSAENAAPAAAGVQNAQPANAAAQNIAANPAGQTVSTSAPRGGGAGQ